jgi:hypothetical protein
MLLKSTGWPKQVTTPQTHICMHIQIDSTSLQYAHAKLNIEKCAHKQLPNLSTQSHYIGNGHSSRLSEIAYDVLDDGLQGLLS